MVIFPTMPNKGELEGKYFKRNGNDSITYYLKYISYSQTEKLFTFDCLAISHISNFRLFSNSTTPRLDCEEITEQEYLDAIAYYQKWLQEDQTGIMINSL